MTRSLDARIADVRRVLEAAQGVARDPALVAPLVESTGLSRQGVELALARHLETEATDEELAALVKGAGEAARVHVILSANVFVAPLRALALALAASEDVTIKPSRREPHFTRALVAALGDPRVALSIQRPAEIEDGEIHVYGRDETIEAVRNAAPPSVRVRGHGHGMGVALVTRGADAPHVLAAAQALAEDVIAFDQRGCLSPRAVFVIGDALAFGHALRDALDARARSVPVGSLDQSEIADLAWWASTASYAGTLLRGESCAVGVLEELTLPPTGRHVVVMPIASPDEFTRRLDRAARHTVMVGSDALDVARALAPAHARVAPLGQMQRPPLDGPVDRR